LNITLPSDVVERLVLALERIADAVELIAGPVVPEPSFTPYPALDWQESSNAQSRAVEEEERREAQGFGPEYERKLEAAAISILKRTGLEQPPRPNVADDQVE